MKDSDSKGSQMGEEGSSSRDQRMTYLLESVTHRQSKEGIFLKEISERGEEGISPRDLISPKEKRSHRRKPE
jgi:hypothetical protein